MHHKVYESIPKWTDFSSVDAKFLAYWKIGDKRIDVSINKREGNFNIDVDIYLESISSQVSRKKLEENYRFNSPEK